MQIRTIDVEILREGPRRHQVLSPLTHYLATCTDSPVGRLVLPTPTFQHADFERRLEELRYEVVSDQPGRLRGLLHDTGDVIAALLSDVPGLPGALTADGNPDDSLVHLRLTTSAAELARIPFELSKMPAGSNAPPDSWMLLQRPIVLTRRNRSVVPSRRRWGHKPLILFVVGPGVGTDASRQHLEVLRAALAPWSRCPEHRGPDDKPGAAPWLQVLEGDHATLDAIAAAMATRPTHVHVLAHGELDPDDPNGHYGVALHDTVASGERLATTLRHVDGSGLHLPTVVTLATCDSANEPSPLAPDASVAFSLHASGIPVVVASQFPLSIDGSIPFVQTLYDDLLWGRHPLESLHKVRLALHRSHSDVAHDWCAVAAYEALPVNLDEQLADLAYWQARRAHESALRRLEWRCGQAADDTEDAATIHEYQRLVADVEQATTRLPEAGSFAVEAMGLNAAGHKRIAEAAYWTAIRMDDARLFAESARHLTDSLGIYERAVNQLVRSDGEIVNRKVSLHWMLTQVVSTRLLKTQSADDPGDAPFGEYEAALWAMSKLSAEVDHRSSDQVTRAWGYVSLTELWLLKLADGSLDDNGRALAAERACEYAHEIVGTAGADAEQTVNTRRQIHRYIRWWGHDGFNDNMGQHQIRVADVWAGSLRVTAEEIVEILGGPDRPLLHPDCADEPAAAQTDDADDE